VAASAKGTAKGESTYSTVETPVRTWPLQQVTPLASTPSAQQGETEENGMLLLSKAAWILCAASAVGASSSQRKYDGSTLSYDPKVRALRR